MSKAGGTSSAPQIQENVRKTKHPRIDSAEEDGRTRSKMRQCILTENRRKNVCLIDALRSLGAAIQYDRDGPLYAMGDGNTILAPHGTLGWNQFD